jgi:hypothetical protein
VTRSVGENARGAADMRGFRVRLCLSAERCRTE